MSIHHTVILYFQKANNIDYLQLLNQTKPYIDEIPGIVSYDIIKNDSKYTPENVISYGVEIIFENQKSFSIFMEHPSHYEANKIFEQHLSDPPYAVLTYEKND